MYARHAIAANRVGHSTRPGRVLTDRIDSVTRSIADCTILEICPKAAPNCKAPAELGLLGNRAYRKLASDRL